MAKIIYPFYFIYQWLIAIPLFAVATVLTALSTMILSPLFPNSKLSYLPARMWGKFSCYIFFVRVKCNGFEHLNPKQSYIFASNHQSVFDILTIYGWILFIFKWVMKSDLRKIPFIGKASASAGHIFIDRSNPMAAKHSMEKAAEQLQHGVSVVIFPEGTRTRTGKLGKFKRGAFMLASELQLPIVPITLSGSFERLPMHHLLVKPGKITMTVHSPIDVSIYEANQSDLIKATYDIIESGL